MNPLWYVLEFFVGSWSNWEHDREWAKKMCICGHKYFKHEQGQDKKRPVNACNKCDCNSWSEVKK